ncbi:MAG: M15 family metallopeptidase [Brevinematales bacterium]|nr:M15 family metallopeptidase [Brevinematales bacterium]
MKYIALFFTISLLHCEITKDELLGKITPYNHPEFTKIESNGKSFWLREEVALKFKEMAKEAKKEGINLYIVSAFRSFEEQKLIWQNKTKRYPYDSKTKTVKKVLEYSAMPGTSRHHWGTDIDIVSVNPAFFDSKQGRKLFNWLTNNAPKYGFFMPYSRYRTNGYREEKWHWSYKPIAEKFLSEYTNLITYKDLAGFYGSELAENLKIIENYVLNISEN